MSDEAVARSLFEVEAAQVLRTATERATALELSLDESARVLHRGSLEQRLRELEHLRELQRLVKARLDVLLRRVVEGAP